MADYLCPRCGGPADGASCRTCGVEFVRPARSADPATGEVHVREDVAEPWWDPTGPGPSRVQEPTQPYAAVPDPARPAPVAPGPVSRDPDAARTSPVMPGPGAPLDPSAQYSGPSGPFRGLVVGVVAGALVLAGAGLVLATRGPAPGAGAGPAPAPVVTVTASATASAGRSPSTTASSTPSGLPAGASECGTDATLGPVGRVVAGNSKTSCGFALAVRAAYVQAKAVPPAQVSVTATSPVTKKAYPMSCAGRAPVTCTGGVGAQVLLFPAGD